MLDALTDSLDQLVSDKEAIKLDKVKKIKPLPKVPSDQILFHGPQLPNAKPSLSKFQ